MSVRSDCTLAGLTATALRLGKEAVHTMCEMKYGTALCTPRETIVLTALSEDAKEGIRACFEKRRPQWKGR